MAYQEAKRLIEDRFGGRTRVIFKSRIDAIYIPKIYKHIVYNYNMEDLQKKINRDLKKIESYERYLKDAATFEKEALKDAIDFLVREVGKLCELAGMIGLDMHCHDFMYEKTLKNFYDL